MKLADKEKIDIEVIESTLTPESKSILDEFLVNYKKSAWKNLKSKILRSYYFEIMKGDFKLWNYGDFMKVVPNEQVETFTTQDRYLKSFFLYLYIKDYLLNESGFENQWVKQVELERYEKRVNKTGEKNATETDNALTLEEVFRIQAAVNVETKDILTLKMQFCWYALFELCIEIPSLKKNIDANVNLEENMIIISNTEYVLPEKYVYLFTQLQDKSNNGFSSADYLLEQLGKVVGLTKKLIPRDIKKTREKLLMDCRNCKQRKLNIDENWVVVNGRIVCYDCGETLKKNFNFNVSEIPTVELSEAEFENVIALYEFETLKEKLRNTQIDYLKLHEFQIQVGKLGEIFAYEYERKKLKGTRYVEKIDRTKALNPMNGYDLLSYELDGTELRIEVKATVGEESKFYVSQNEVETFESTINRGDKYYIYLLTGILSDSPKLTIIENLLNDSRLMFKGKSWLVEVI